MELPELSSTNAVFQGKWVADIHDGLGNQTHGARKLLCFPAMGRLSPPSCGCDGFRCVESGTPD